MYFFLSDNTFIYITREVDTPVSEGLWFVQIQAIGRYI